MKPVRVMAIHSKCLLITLALLLTVNLPVAGQAQGDDEAEARARLEQLKQDMARLSEELQTDRAEQGSLQSALRDSEVAIGQIQGDIKKTREELAWSRQQLKGMTQQRKELQVARGQQQELIVRELQTAYQMGRQSQLKILLNQEQPDTLARSMAYYQYFYEARQANIESYLNIIARIDELEPEIVATTEQLATSEATLEQQRQTLLASRAQREEDLALLNASIRTKDERLARMSADREELESLLVLIEEAVAQLAQPEAYQAFAELKGGMPRPLPGKPSNRYGAKRSGSLKWQGWSIPADTGTIVSAIHQGHVVFADWFRGSGLLLIIDHGDGYMSLYAHNEALLREVGEWVPAGAAISTVGNSGGQNQAALYFEIRENGKPTNPARWLQSG